MPRSPIYSDVLVNGYEGPRIFEKLPVELREMVWEEYMRAERSYMNLKEYQSFGLKEYSYFFFWKKKTWCFYSRWYNSTFPSLCYVSKATREEALGVFLRNSKLDIKSSEDAASFKIFLDSNANSANHVRELYFSNSHRLTISTGDIEQLSDSKADLLLAASCPNLRTLRLKFPMWSMLVAPEGLIRTWEPKTTEQIVIEYSLHMLFDCKRLRKIQLCGIYYSRPRRRTANERTLHDLATWLKDAFAKEDHQIEFIVV
jgi:hypothetical protein